VFPTSTDKPHSWASKSMSQFTTQDVSVVVCTKNSISGIQACLKSIREANVGQLIVVDAHSTDGTMEFAGELADVVLTDPGSGLGNARNVGIKETTRSLILNMGSDNVLPAGELEKMIKYLQTGNLHGVAAQTQIVGEDFCSRGLNAWRAGRFTEGERTVIGTPTLFLGEILRENPYDPSRKFSDDSELCERWAKEFGARFAISNAYVLEVGKTSWQEVRIRAKMYGISDHEIFIENSNRWTLLRKAKSLSHPITSDFVTPVRHLPLSQAASAIPFLGAFTALRYAGWITSSLAK
jgi:glycosyltransferase involved in cell wall biosynthesis